MLTRFQFGLAVFALTAFYAQAQPGQPAPMQQSYSLQDSNLKVQVPGALKGVGIDQHLDAQLPLDTVFRDEFGRNVPLSTYFHDGKPVILALVYYRCPMLCTEILNGVEATLRLITLTPGKDFEVVAISFDPKDTPEIAAEKKQNYLRRFRRPDTANGWHFLTGEEPNIHRITDAIGFHYSYDAKTDQFAHASAIYVITPQGKISKYFYGVEYPGRDLRLGLVDASQGRIGTAADQILLFCFHYDPKTGKYGAVAIDSLRAVGATFVLVCGACLFIFIRRDNKTSKRVTERNG